MSDLHDDIEKYLRGDLTEAEMHRLEKQALNDPFLAEALEGASLVPAEDFSNDIKDLKQSLHRRVERKVVPIWLWSARIAAGLIILAITGYIAFSLIDGNAPKTDLALNKNDNAVTQPAPKEEVSVPEPAIATTPESVTEASKREREMPQRLEKSTTDDSKVDTESLLEEKAKESQEERKEEKPVIQNEPAETRVPGELEADTQSKMDGASDQFADKETARDMEGPKKKMSTFALSSPAAAPVHARRSKKESRVLQGKVIDEDGAPMPGVSVALKDSDSGTVTDENGNYTLSLSADPKGELVFSFVGMQKTEIPITSNDSINAKLTPDFAELSEVVVVGYGSINDDDALKKEDISVYQPASPEGGKKAYKNYLVENLRYPQQAIEAKVQGRVTIQFVVETSGNLNDFRIVKGIGHGCDDEVIRLIKQGPKWIPTKRNDVPTKGKVKVRLKFTLPD